MRQLLTYSPRVGSKRITGAVSSTFLHPIFGKRILDGPRRLFRGLGLSRYCSCFIIEEPTRIRPEELVHRDTDPYRCAVLLRNTWRVR